jgi:hypothetical protein
MSHKTKITIKKANHKNYEVQSPINQLLKDEIKNKNKNIVFFLKKKKQQKEKKTLFIK